jgi:nucleoid DNA-binding protein
MNKNDIIDQIAATLGDRRQAEAAMDSLLAQITGALNKGESVTLSGFGTFRRVRRKARQGVNPRTGEKIRIGARQVARFSPGTRLQKAVN